MSRNENICFKYRIKYIRIHTTAQKMQKRRFSKIHIEKINRLRIYRLFIIKCIQFYALNDLYTLLNCSLRANWRVVSLTDNVWKAGLSVAIKQGKYIKWRAFAQNIIIDAKRWHKVIFFKWWSFLRHAGDKRVAFANWTNSTRTT